MARHRLRAVTAGIAGVGCLLVSAVTAPAAPPATAHPAILPTWSAPTASTAITPSPTGSVSEAAPSSSASTTPAPTRPVVGPTVPRTTDNTPDTVADNPGLSNPPIPDATTDSAPAPSDNPTDTAGPPTAPATTAGEVEPLPSPSDPAPVLDTISARYTGYGYQDNDCDGPGDCTAYGDGHAGGTGTYTDPVTVAVGRDQLDQWPAGTVLYLVDLHRYGVVEDRCGACEGAWVDVWVDGRGTPDDGVACMRSFTGQGQIVIDPPADLPTNPGTISTAEGCNR